MVLVDSNVLLDIFTNDPEWAAWSAEQLSACADRGLAINPIIYAELSPAFSAEGELEHILAGWPFERLELPYPAAFVAGQAFLRYRRSGGTRPTPLPDFYIGAQALVADLTLLTRDAQRYRTYFPGLRLIAPA